MSSDRVPLPPLEVFAIDAAMNRSTGSIPYTSLIWTRRYTKPGQFEMVVPADIYDSSWAYICCDDRPETGIVQKVEFSDTAQTKDGIDTVTVSGFFLEAVLNNIVFLVEAPEKEKVYVPMPRRPTFSHKKQDTKVYADPIGELYYQNSSGEVVSSKDGRVVNTNGLTEIDYKDAFGSSFGNPDSGTCTYDYYYSNDENKIHTIDLIGADAGTEKVYDIEFSDDKGNVFYYNDSGRLTQAVGVVEKRENTYSVRKKAWNALADDDPYGRYYLVDVKGPWQRTEMMEPVTEGDSIEIVLKWARRMMGDWILYEEPTIKGIQKCVDPSLQYLGDLLYKTLYEVEASLRLEYLFDKNIAILSVYKGKDRTQSQSGNPWAVFSDTWGTLNGYIASRDESNYKNTCFVLFEYDKPDSFDSSGWPVAGFICGIDDMLALPTLYGIKHTSKRGYNTEHVGDPDEPAIETYLDLRSEKPSCDGDWSRDIVELPGTSGEEREQAIASAKQKFAKPADAYDMRAVYEAYESALPGRGEAHLKENYSVVTNLDTGVIDTSAYLRDFDLGDKVDLVLETVGLAKEARIISVEEAYDEDGAAITIEMGDEKMNIIKKARLA